MTITASEFNKRRAELIQLHEENSGKRGFGREATARKIAALLGYTEENCSGYWGDRKTYFGLDKDSPAPMFPCPVNKPYVRQSFLHVKSCPAGLWSPMLNLQIGNSWDGKSTYDFCPRFTFPDVWADNVLATAFDVMVYDTKKEALKAAQHEGWLWLDREVSNLDMLLRNPNDACPVSADKLRKTFESALKMLTWLGEYELGAQIDRECEETVSLAAVRTESGLAVPESAIEPVQDGGSRILYEFRCSKGPYSVSADALTFGDAKASFGCESCNFFPCSGPTWVCRTVGCSEDEATDVEFSKGEKNTSSGQQRLAGEDVMPTAEPVKGDPELTKVKDKYDEIRLKIQTEKQAIKEIKEEALAPHKSEISEKESTIELMSFVMTLFEVQTAKAEAKIKSKHEDPTFCVYAYTLTGFKGVRVQVGTKQDIRDLEYQHDGVHSYVLAEFLNGEEVTDREE
ncbi:hypothetical protein [Cloacibacillus sp.]|uniref:hypothetical protein n=1 Tax=Cloacibacillus sp. TaxID=2049023 RepID=UPI0025C3A78C|nr:hypothetical protein [Cloacibacillus sp.]MCC8056406.1 hypothetical protein [Cloacibacillus sp.]